MKPLAQTLKILATTLDQLGIAYAIGGSVASSARGEYRAMELFGDDWWEWSNEQEKFHVILSQ